MDEAYQNLLRSAQLVKTWGGAKLPNGKALGEMLSIQGVSLWEAGAVELALYHVPRSCRGERSLSFWQQGRSYLSRAKYAATDLFKAGRSTEGCAGWPQPPVFLFLGFSPYIYRDVLEPVVAHLEEGQEIRAVSLHDKEPEYTSNSKKGGQRFQSIWEHWDDEVKLQTKQLRKAFGLAVAELQAMGALPQIIQDQGSSLWPLLKDRFNWLFRVSLPRLLPQVAIARHILQQHRPALIVSPDVADPRTRLYCLLGRQLGIPSLEIQFGIYGPTAVEWQFFVADRLAVWGEKSRQMLMDHGVPAKRITLSGSPRHDTMINVSREEVFRTRQQLGVSQGKAMVLFASTYSLSTYGNLLNPTALANLKKAIFQAADQVAGLCLVVKPHPLEDLREIKKLARGVENLVFADAQGDIRELIKAADAFVTLGTTATLDALIANKLVICPAFPDWVHGDIFVQSEATLVPRTPEEVTQCLQLAANGSRERVLADLEPARQRFLEHWVYQADGQSSARIATLALEMAQSFQGKLE